MSGDLTGLCLYMPQAGFKPHLVDDTSYEADAIPTKPPWLDHKSVYMSGLCHIMSMICTAIDKENFGDRIKNAPFLWPKNCFPLFIPNKFLTWPYS